jgi:hypothetical protein
MFTLPLALLSLSNLPGVVDVGIASGVASELGERRGRGCSGIRIARIMVGCGRGGVAGTMVVCFTGKFCTCE